MCNWYTHFSALLVLKIGWPACACMLSQSSFAMVGFQIMATLVWLGFSLCMEENTLSRALNASESFLMLSPNMVVEGLTVLIKFPTGRAEERCHLLPGCAGSWLPWIILWEKVENIFFDDFSFSSCQLSNSVNTRWQTILRVSCLNLYFFLLKNVE